MSRFEIDVRAQQGAEQAVVDGSTAIMIRSDENVFTRLLRPGRDESDDYLIAPPAQLAFWLSDNWWRVRWESVPPTGMSADWRLAHELSSIGGGYVWPRLSIWGEGARIGLISRMDHVGVITPVRFLTDALVFVDGSEFESVVDRFLEEALERWVGHSDREALQAQVLSLRTERMDPEFAAWRRLEARLGFDPDKAPEKLMETLANLVDLYGQSGVEEAAQAAPGVGAAATLVQEIEIAKQVHAECELATASQTVPEAAINSALPPWVIAEEAAVMVRRSFGYDRGPLQNKRLAEVLGTRVTALHSSHSGDYRTHEYGLRLRTGSEGRDIVSLRSRWSHDRRFEMSRALADVIWANNDDIGPIARSKTARQKFQRAFAQSLLCPFDDLMEFLDTDSPSEGDLTAAARHFHVSERVVRTVLVNKRIANREILNVSAEANAIEELLEAA
jgi:hypothetical protein